MARRVQLRTDVADNHFPVLIHNPGGVALHTGEAAKKKEKGKNHVPPLSRASHPLGGLLAPLVLMGLESGCSPLRLHSIGGSVPSPLVFGGFELSDSRLTKDGQDLIPCARMKVHDEALGLNTTLMGSHHDFAFKRFAVALKGHEFRACDGE